MKFEIIVIVINYNNIGELTKYHKIMYSILN